MLWTGIQEFLVLLCVGECQNEIQAGSGIVQRVAEDLLQLPQPVSHRLRMDMEPGGDVGHIAAAQQPRQQGLG